MLANYKNNDLLSKAMTRHRKDVDDDSKTKLGFYFSRTGSVDGADMPNLRMYCPRCKAWVNQIKSFFRFDSKHEMPCVCCERCNLIHDSALYKKLIKELRAKGEKLPI